ncbi:MAG: hypothetical protein HY744_34680 [Deltaproteobacteria bacterium]|nr:hypothetical protein [Deltaproteobacteria bacterium]
MGSVQWGYLLPSAAIGLPRGKIRHWESHEDRPPRVGDVVYGRIARIGQHSSLENAAGRIHHIYGGTRAVFVFGNRYAPDYYEGVVPERWQPEADLLARSGIVGVMRAKNSRIKDPTRVELWGYVRGPGGAIMSTLDHPLVRPRTEILRFPRARMILVCGTAMNSGKSMAAAACCWALTSLGLRVRASKLTGTASLKDILHMNDAGAHPYADFTFLGYPSTYLLPESDLLRIFRHLDLKYANNAHNFWVVELADGVGQRETAMLLESEQVRSRIHRLIFCAADALGARGGLQTLGERFGLTPHALSGLCCCSPLHLRELRELTALPAFNSAEVSPPELAPLLLGDAGGAASTRLAPASPATQG